MKHVITIIFIFLGVLVYSQKRQPYGFNGGEFGFGTSVSVSEAVDYNDAADALFARMDVQPDAKLKQVISTIYDTLQFYHIDDTLDRFAYRGLHTAQAATLDWLTNTSITLVNSPTFTAYEGFTTDGLSSYYRLNYNPEIDKIHYRLNSASLVIFIRTNNYTTNKVLIGCIDGTYAVYIYLSGSNFVLRLHNSSTGDHTLGHNNNILGSNCVVRQNSNTLAYSRNGAEYTTKSSTPNGIVNQALGIFVGAENNQGSPSYYTNNQFLADGVGGQLTALQNTKLFQIIEWAADQYGKGVVP